MPASCVATTRVAEPYRQVADGFGDGCGDGAFGLTIETELLMAASFAAQLLLAEFVEARVAVWIEE